MSGAASRAMDPSAAEAARRLGETIAGARRAVAFTGAGISTESGIPDFRSPTGIWSKLDPAEFTIQNYVASPEHRARVWRLRLEAAAERYEPNDAHRALAELERLGILDCVVTQNIDGLHQQAGSGTVLELHGHTREVACLGCGDRRPSEEVLARVRGGEEDPACERCGGILKSATVSFGQGLPEDVVAEAFRRAESCDLCLVIGSSLVVYPAAHVPLAAAEAGARLAIVNAEPTPLDRLADPVVHGRAGPVMTAALAAARERLGS